MKQSKSYSFFIFGTSEKAREMAAELASGGHTVTVSQTYMAGDYDALIFMDVPYIDKKLKAGIKCFTEKILEEKC